MSEGFSGRGKDRKSISASASRKHGRINNTEHKDIKKALKLMQQSNYKDAEVIYKKLIKEKTRNYAVFENLAVIYYKKGKIEEMIMLLKEALKLNPDHLEGLLNMGAALVDLGKLQEGIAYYEKALAIDPNSLVALTNLGVALRQLGKTQEGIAYYKKALTIDPNSRKVLTNLGAALVDLGKPQEGINYYKKALAIDPNSLRALTNLGAVLVDLGKFRESIAYYKKALAIDPNSRKVLTNLGTALVQLGKSQEGITYYKEALAIDPNSPAVLTNLGAALVQLGKTQKGIAYYKKALAIDPNSPAALTNLGAALVDIGKIQEGTAYYKKALAIDPNSPAVLTNLGAALVQLGKSHEGIDYCKKALAIDPNSPVVLTNLGAALVQLEEYHEGIDYCKKALAIDPNSPEVLTNLGAALRQLGEPQDGIAYHKKALAIDPDSPAALTNLGAALVQLRKIQEGIAYHKKALAIDPNSPAALTNLGFALMLSGELQEASNTHQKAISLQPDYILAHWNLSFSLLSSGDYENGWKEYEWRFRRLRIEDMLHTHPPQLKRWDGSSRCSGDRLVLVGEQGLGDIIQFMRYIPYLRKRGMVVAFYTETKLHGLIQASGITSEIYSPEEVHQLTTGEWLPLLSLPMHLEVRPDNPLVQEPYIKTPAERTLYWKQKLSSEKRPIVGINWQGNASAERHTMRGRSLPLEAFTSLTENIDASFLSLQKGDGSEQLTDCKFLDRFVGCQEEINQTWDFVESSAIIMNCDLIITMDTVVAHLAGGLGKTTWLLLHKPSDWRWGMEGDTTFWYPSMRLFRQRERGNWQEVMDRVATALQEAYSQGFICEDFSGPGRSRKSISTSVSKKHDRIHDTERENIKKALKFMQQGNYKNAEVVYRKLIEEKTRNYAVFGNLAIICYKKGKIEEMIIFLKEALKLNSNCPEGLLNMGAALVDLGETQEGIAYYKKALAIDPNSPAALTNLGVALVDLGETQEGIAYYRKALAIDPNSPAALTNLGFALVDLGETQEGIAYHEKALAIDPNSPAALTGLGAALADLGEIQEGINYYKKALAIDPNFPGALTNLGFALVDLGETQKGIAYHRKAISLRPDYPTAHWNLSFSLLSSGNYENGWKEHEWRLRVQDTLHAHLPQLKRWDGSSRCSEKRLVLVGEQGLGDIIQFMRYIPYLRKRGMVVAFCTKTKLHGLIQASGVASEIYDPEEAHQLTTGEWLPLLSLPMHLEVRPDNLLVQEPYIKTPAERTLYWKQKLSSEKRPIVGINWQGNASAERHTMRGRSLPLEAFTSLTENIDVSFLSLQKGDGSEQLTDCKFLDRFVGCQEEINQTWDFVESSAIIMNCDLIITMDTVVAHLAGGLGKTTWLLLHKPSDWRWGMEGDTTFWYPSMRLFRQRERGNWQEVMDRVATALQGAYSQQFIQATR